MTAPTRRPPVRRPGPPRADGRAQHLNWLAMVEVSGPFLTLPVLLHTWPTLDALEKPDRERLRAAHAAWRTDPEAVQPWIEYVLTDLLDWGHACESDTDELARLRIHVDEYDLDLTPSFALVEPGEPVKPDTCRLLGLVCPPNVTPTGRYRGQAWAATPVDRVARLCRAHAVELGLVTDGRWWTLVWAPRGGVTTTATFDAMTWPEQADRDLVRAFRSLLYRRRFFAVPDEQTLVPLLRRSLAGGEEVTEALGTQVRRAVELLVDAIGRYDTRARERGLNGLGETPAHEVYRAAVTVMMRVVFLLFAEERGLLPADNDLYLEAYSAGRLCEVLERQAREGSEEDLEHSTAGWLRLLALFTAVHSGVFHKRLRLPAYDGSIFDPTAFAWLPEIRVDDRTVMHILRAVQYVEIGRERRRLSFRALDVEQIGYVYEGLLSYEGRRASETVVGLIGKAGLEEEVPLSTLEAHRRTADSPDALAERLAEVYKDSRLGTPVALARRLAPLPEGERAEATRRLLAATAGDAALAERLLPFYGIIRTDLRGLPVVIGQDALYVTESRLRRTTGTHYTPRFLAEEVAEGALEPLVHSPGPLQTADEKAWRPVSSQTILNLKVADIAMGSGAFLVAACRYLAGKLVEAWAREGDQRAWRHINDANDRDAPVDVEADPVVIEARRQIIEHCLYGVDINAMAVEMAKLSLWLVSMDPERPFTFLDDRLVTGDSLLGITNVEQLEYMHLDPKAGRHLHDDTLFDYTAGVRSLVAEVAQQRQELAELPDDTVELVAGKGRLLTEVTARTAEMRRYADLVVGAALASAGQRPADHKRLALRAAALAALMSIGEPEGLEEAAAEAKRWLSTDRPTGTADREPLHWPLVFPEVFARDGFSAIVGNPPFLGGKKISGATGSAYREYLVEVIGGDVKGNADLVAFFVLRAHELLREAGEAGLIATNTLAQGDTREVGLDQVLASGVEIRQAIKSKPWPSRSAVLQYCAVWTSRAGMMPGAIRLLDESPVAGITASLEPRSRARGNPKRLAINQDIAFQGCNIVGIGFVMSHEEAEDLIRRDSRSSEVLRLFLNGEDLNTTPDSSARRQVIDFNDSSLARAADYPACLERVRRLVKPQRDKLPDYKRRVRESWWRYEHNAPALRKAIEGMEWVIAMTRVSKVVMPVLVPTGQVYSDAVVVFATDDPAMLALLSSAPHYWWAIRRASTMKGDLRYTPTDVFETLARPEPRREMRALGERLDSYRRAKVMLARNAGLTTTYNLVHDPACRDSDIAGLRDIHIAIDEAVMRAYGWDDLPLDHGFHETRQGIRFTVGPVARQEILDRLLELNHERYAAEVAAGLHVTKKARRGSNQEGLFDA